MDVYIGPVVRRASLCERLALVSRAAFSRPTDQLVLIQLIARFANPRGGHAAPRLALLNRYVGIAPETLKRSLHRLVRDRWLFAERSPSHPTIYTINLTTLAETEAAS